LTKLPLHVLSAISQTSQNGMNKIIVALLALDLLQILSRDTVDAYCTELVKCTAQSHTLHPWQVNKGQSQRTMHDALIWQLTHESTRMLAIWESHETAR